MFERLSVPILGIIENMSYFLCPHCNEKTEIFRTDGGKNTSERFGVAFLGQIPLDAEVCTAGDIGVPIVAGHPESPTIRSVRGSRLGINGGPGGKWRRRRIDDPLILNTAKKLLTISFFSVTVGLDSYPKPLTLSHLSYRETLRKEATHGEHRLGKCLQKTRRKTRH